MSRKTLHQHYRRELSGRTPADTFMRAVKDAVKLHEARIEPPLVEGVQE